MLILYVYAHTSWRAAFEWFVIFEAHFPTYPSPPVAVPYSLFSFLQLTEFIYLIDLIATTETQTVKTYTHTHSGGRIGKNRFYIYFQNFVIIDFEQQKHSVVTRLALVALLKHTVSFIYSFLFLFFVFVWKSQNLINI